MSITVDLSSLLGRGVGRQPISTKLSQSRKDVPASRKPQEDRDTKTAGSNIRGVGKESAKKESGEEVV